MIPLAELFALLCRNACVISLAHAASRSRAGKLIALHISCYRIALNSLVLATVLILMPRIRLEQYLRHALRSLNKVCSSCTPLRLLPHVHCVHTLFIACSAFLLLGY